MDMTTVWVGDVAHLRQGCFYFYFQNASTFASLHVSIALRARGVVSGCPQSLAGRAFPRSVRSPLKSDEQNRHS